ncbi:MAG TPA: hypothetical protein VHJ34_06905 [Actinomycetota bacterium]|nr:hypothetical protein [Actinomycetota bacterium]
MSDGRTWAAGTIVALLCALAVACDGGAAPDPRSGSIPVEVATSTPVESPASDVSPKARARIDAYTTELCRGWRAWADTLRASFRTLRRAQGDVDRVPEAKTALVSYVQATMAATHQFGNFLRNTAPPRAADLPGAHLVLVSAIDQAQGRLGVRVARAYALPTTDLDAFAEGAADVARSVGRDLQRVTAMFVVTYAEPVVVDSLRDVAACAPLHGDLGAEDVDKA